MQDSRYLQNRRVALLLAGGAAGMVGLSFAAVPLYRLFCQVTGFAGTTQVAKEAPGARSGHRIVVRFDVNVAPGLPWSFAAPKAVTIGLGEQMQTAYTARNMGDRPVLGTATFNVVPEATGAYFNKIQCFCFTEQLLMPGEAKEFPLVFFRRRSQHGPRVHHHAVLHLLQRRPRGATAVSEEESGRCGACLAGPEGAMTQRVYLLRGPWTASTLQGGSPLPGSTFTPSQQGYERSIHMTPVVRLLGPVMVAASVLAGLQLAQATIARADQVAGALAYAPQADALYRSDGRALYRSMDNGRDWTGLPLPASPESGRIATIAASPIGQGTLYVAGRGVGVLKSVNQGKTWVPIGKGLPSDDVVALAAHSSAADTVYALLAAEGIYRSEDGGKRWRMVDKGPPAIVRKFIHSGMEGSMQSGWLFAATDEGVYRAMDCFCGFRLAGTLSGPVAAVTYDPKQPKELYAAVGKDVFSTANGGEDWQKVGSPGGKVDALTYSPSGGLYALLADGRVVRSRDKGRQWE